MTTTAVANQPNPLPAPPSTTAGEKVIIRCPSCSAQFRINRLLLRRKARCTKCGEEFVAIEVGSNPPPLSASQPGLAVGGTERNGGSAPVSIDSSANGRDAGAPAVVVRATPSPAPPPAPGSGAVNPASNPAPESSRNQRDARIGQMLGQFKILGVLGRGGMGVVYEAEDSLLHRRVALKVLSSSMAAYGQEGLERFLREARSAARLEHPNIVGIYHVAIHDGVPAIAMQLVRGGSASDFVKENGPMTPADATRVVTETARALAAAHDAGVVHRDIKPANIMLGPNWSVKVTDFGLAKIEDGTVTTSGVMGTPVYMSPEACRGEPADARSDLYSLGATYFALLTGQPPYRGDSPHAVMFKHIYDPVPDPRDYQPGIPAGCVRVLQRAMDKDPSRRYQSAVEMISDLQALDFSAQPSDNPTNSAMQDWAALVAATQGAMSDAEVVPASPAAGLAPALAAAAPIGQGGFSGPGSGSYSALTRTMLAGPAARRKSVRYDYSLVVALLVAVVVLGVGLTIYFSTSTREPATPTPGTDVGKQRDAEPNRDSIGDVDTPSELPDVTSTMSTLLTKTQTDPRGPEFQRLLLAATAAVDKPQPEFERAIDALLAMRTRCAAHTDAASRSFVEEIDRVVRKLRADRERPDVETKTPSELNTPNDSQPLRSELPVWPGAKLLREWPSTGKGHLRAYFLNRGQSVLICMGDGSAQLWSPATTATTPLLQMNLPEALQQNNKIGPQRWVADQLVSPDERWLLISVHSPRAVANLLNTVLLVYDCQKGRLFGYWRPHVGGLSRCKFTSNGNTLITYGLDNDRLGELKLWNFAEWVSSARTPGSSPTQLQRISGHHDGVVEFLVNDDLRSAVTMGLARSKRPELLYWNLTTGQSMGPLSAPISTFGHPASRHLALSAEDAQVHWLVDNRLITWKPGTESHEVDLSQNLGQILWARPLQDPQGRWVLFSSNAPMQTRLGVLDPTTGKVLTTLPVPAQGNFGFGELSPDGSVLAAVINYMKTSETLAGSPRPVSSMHLWTIDSGKVAPRPVRNVLPGIERIRFSPNGRVCGFFAMLWGASGRIDTRELLLLDIATGKCFRLPKTVPHLGLQVMFSPDGEQLLVIGQDEVQLWALPRPE